MRRPVHGLVAPFLSGTMLRCTSGDRADAVE
jgi:hypothetical protein